MFQDGGLAHPPRSGEQDGPLEFGGMEEPSAGKKGEPPKRQVLALVTKAKDYTTLGKLFAPKKIRGSQIGLKPISEENRYKGKVNWESKREQIGVWLSDGLSIRGAAKKLGVSPSTLSEANKRLGLYEPRKSPI